MPPVAEIVQAALPPVRGTKNGLRSVSERCFCSAKTRSPLSYQFACAHKFAGIILVISEQFTTAGINPQLLEIILEPFKQFQSEEESTYPSYHILYYLNILLDRLLQLASPGAVTNNIHQEVQQLLLELNFNSDRYYTYCTNLVKSEIAALPIKEQLEQLNWMQKQINQVPPKAGFIYNPLHAGLHQLLQVWFTEEIAYLDRMFYLSNTNHATDELLRWKNFKILTQLSVAQLGHLLKLFTDTGILLNQNKTELLEFYSCFVACRAVWREAGDAGKGCLKNSKKAHIFKIRQTYTIHWL